MNQHDVGMIIQALSSPGAAFVFGAGASAPAVPTFAQLAHTIASHVGRLNSFPGSPISQSRLRDLMQPVLDKAQSTTRLDEWKAAAMTTATIAAILEQIISRAHLLALPQYTIFSQFSLDSSIVSFNWDGLAIARCPQRTILHPHGIVHPRLLDDSKWAELLWDTQLIDDPSARYWYLPDLIMPGEETGPLLRDIREEVLQLWMKAPSAVVIGYSFGRASGTSYDAVWLDSFAEAFSRNREAPVHIVSPDARMICEAICDRIRRHINVFAWPVKWDVLAAALLAELAKAAAPLAALRLDGESLDAVLDAIHARADSVG